MVHAYWPLSELVVYTRWEPDGLIRPRGPTWPVLGDTTASGTPPGDSEEAPLLASGHLLLHLASPGTRGKGTWQAGQVCTKCTKTLPAVPQIHLPCLPQTAQVRLDVPIPASPLQCPPAQKELVCSP